MKKIKYLLKTEDIKSLQKFVRSRGIEKFKYLALIVGIPMVFVILIIWIYIEKRSFSFLIQGGPYMLIPVLVAIVTIFLQKKVHTNAIKNLVFWRMK